MRRGYRNLRHGTRAALNYLANRTRLSALRYATKRRFRERPIVGILLLEHIGDIIACEPVARYVRARTPDAYIVWCVRPDYRELVAGNPAVDRVLQVHCLSVRLWLAWSRLFDEVIDLHLPGRFCCLCAKPALRDSAPVDLSNFYRFGGILESFCLAAGLPALADAPRIHIPQAARRAVDALRLPAQFIVIHASANSPAKEWPAEKWHELSRRVVTLRGIAIVEIGLAPVLATASTGDGYRDLCGRLSLLETAEVIRRASLFVGIDSGPAHMANAAGTPGVVLLGRYLGFDKYVPFSGRYGEGVNSQLLHSKGHVAEIAVDQVLDAVTACAFR
jgi:ADP-heptose:LPS heptosyltransferase